MTLANIARSGTWVRVAAALLLVGSAAAVAGAQTPLLPSDDAIRQILRTRIDEQKKAVGIVVGVVSARGTRIVEFGVLDEADTRTPVADTVFEIGSASKVFTSLLLTDMVAKGEMSLDDPVSKYLPKDVRMPSRNGREITLRDLSTHVSGLPRLPSNLPSKDPLNPYADYTVRQMYDFLSQYQLERDPGEKYEYSNLAVGLLGHVIGLRAGSDYETVLRTRILEPLRMTSTAIALTDSMRARLAPGHNEALKRVPNWDIATLGGAGAIRSTVADMLIFLKANMGLAPSPLSGAMKAMLGPRRAVSPAMDVALGWHILKDKGSEIVWHNGGTGGYHSFMGFDPKAGTGVVILSNCQGSIDDIGRHILNPQFELVVPVVRKAVAVDPKIFNDYVGAYALTPQLKLTVFREGDKLYAQTTAADRAELLPESPTTFFRADIDFQITFQRDADGRVQGAVVHSQGQNLPVKKILDPAGK